jgi:hypothetical protein
LIGGIALTGVVWLLLLLRSRRALRIDQVFPELRKVPLARMLVGGAEDLE